MLIRGRDTTGCRQRSTRVLVQDLLMPPKFGLNLQNHMHASLLGTRGEYLPRVGGYDTSNGDYAIVVAVALI